MIRFAIIALVLVFGSPVSASDAPPDWLAAMASANIQQDTVGQLAVAMFGGEAASKSLRTANDQLFNELRSPGQRATERVEDLARIGADLQGTTGACAAYTFTPGGTPSKAKWTGPIFTLTQTTGSCIVRPAFRGEGNTRWTRLQSTLGCLGPSTQWGWTPLTYEGPSREPTTLEGPNCKFTYRLGTETTIKISGKQSTTKYSSEKEFYAAGVLMPTFAANLQDAKATLSQLGAVVANQMLAKDAATNWRALSSSIFTGSSERAAKPSFSRLSSLLTEGSTHVRGLGSRTLFRFA